MVRDSSSSRTCAICARSSSEIASAILDLRPTAASPTRKPSNAFERLRKRQMIEGPAFTLSLNETAGERLEPYDVDTIGLQPERPVAVHPDVSSEPGQGQSHVGASQIFMPTVSVCLRVLSHSHLPSPNSLRAKATLAPSIVAVIAAEYSSIFALNKPQIDRRFRKIRIVEQTLVNTSQ